MAGYLDAAIASALKNARKDENFRLKAEQRGSPRGFGEQGNIGKILKGTREHKPIFQ